MNDLNQTIYIVDDDPSIRKSLSRLLKSTGYEVEMFGSAREFLQANTICEGPSCIVLDMKMPELSGFELQEELNRKGYSLPIVFVTGHGDIPMGVKAMKNGAVDFLTKPFDEADLLNAVQEALRRDSKNRKTMDERSTILQKIESLTPREYEILTYVITGMLNKQIAYDLKISEKTVKVHRGRIMEKMGVDSVAQLVRLADKAGIQPAEVSEG
jgi:FixJ family two-component response regulator